MFIGYLELQIFYKIVHIMVLE